MIRVALFGDPSGVKYVQFETVPLVKSEDLRCNAEVKLSFREAVQVAEALAEGEVKGQVEEEQRPRFAIDDLFHEFFQAVQLPRVIIVDGRPFASESRCRTPKA
jgi:hypothetical protein